MGYRRKMRPREKVLSTHEEQAAGDEENDEVPQKSRQPVCEDMDPTHKLDVLCLRDSLSHCQETKATDQNSHAKMYI